MAQQTFSGVPAQFTAGEVAVASDQNLFRDYLIAQIKEGQITDTGEILPMIMDLTNNRIVLDTGGLEFSDGTTQTSAATSGVTWSGSTANGIGTYGSSSSIVSESSATYDGTTLALTTSGGGLKLDNLASSDANTLDDYEEGTCTLTLVPAGGGTITLDSASGKNTAGYVKVGNMVSVGGRVFCSAVSSPSGSVRVDGLPFAVANNTYYESMGVAYLFGQASGNSGLMPTTSKNQTWGYLYYADGTSVAQGGVFDSDTEFQFSITYRAG